ncbi:MAG TPA: hypothetical protein VNM47_09095 [Terriglobia bacterium]|nr:hypothetical protein [Terriglobia bacterium]
MKKLMVVTVLLWVLPTPALAQKAGLEYGWQGYTFLGAGTGARYCGQWCGTIWHVGFGGEGFLYKRLGLGAEAGYFHSGPYNFNYNEGFIVSGDFSYHFRRNAGRGQVDPFVLVGPTAYFPTSHGRGALVGNFGGGFNVWLARHAALRLEIRDYANPRDNGWPGPHSVSFRFGVTFR